MKAIGIAAILLAASACAQTARPSASPSPLPTASAPMVAVLQGNNRVSIVDLQGNVVASATFTPMPVPQFGCMAAVMPQSAHVAAGKVYFADANGVVRSLKMDGTVAKVATFPIASTQQMLSFAVSPDGTKIAGTVFTAPKTAFTCSGAGSGTYTFDAYYATTPTTSDRVYHTSWTSASQSVMALRGWDSMGPFGTDPTVWASQGGGPASALGVFVRIDATTLRPGAPFADSSSCLVWNSVPSGTFVCTASGQTVSVRGADGGELWKVALSGDAVAESAVLAPDSNNVALSGVLVGRDGLQRKLPAGFQAQGWVDASTIIGVSNAQNLPAPPLPIAYVSTSAPDKVTVLPVLGTFLGTMLA